MVALLFCGVSLVDEVSDDLDLSENSASTCDVEGATYPSSYFIISFEPKVALSAALSTPPPRLPKNISCYKVA